MRYIIIILITLFSLNNFAQDILEGERDPIVVETKADLQSELELLPINYQREEKPDSLIKFNYSYHGRPIKTDFLLFPERILRDYLNLSSGSHERIGLRNYLSINNFTQNISYLYRDDDGDRNAHIFSIANNYTFNDQKFSISADYLDSFKQTSLLETSNKTKNIKLAYSLDNFLKYINNITLSAQYETNETSLLSNQEYLNVKTEIEVQPINSIFTNLKFANNHKMTNSQIQIYYQNKAKFGLWSGITEDKATVAPYLDLYYNYNNITLNISNKPYTEHQTYFTQYQKHLYGKYYHEKTDYLVPGNANVEVSYFNFFTWSLGSDYKYCLDVPVYRLGGLGEKVYYDSFWQTSYYAKLAYISNKLNFSTKAEIIEYNNFDADFLPYTPQLRITNSLSYKLNKLTLGTDYRIERQARDDYSNKLDPSHILNAHANYQYNNRISFWTELRNLLDKNYNSYLQDQINMREISVGIKLFF